MSYLIEKKLIIIALTAVALAACSRQSDDAHPETHVAGQGHEGYNHEDGEISDLDLTVAELFADTCEHNIKTHTCNECRYEVGVVKASGNLFEGGLLKTARVEKRTIELPLRLTGAAHFDERLVAHMSTQAKGIIRKVHVTLGDKVKQGQALVEIGSVEVGEAQASYLESRAMLKLASRNHDRMASLRKEGISSEKEMLRAKQEMETAQIRADAALGKLMRLGMSASTARAMTQKRATGRLVLRAPLDGTVLKMHAVAGEVARSEVSLVTVGNNASLWVWADLYERDFARVSLAQAREALVAEIEVKAFPDVSFSGTVDFVSPAMNESSRTVKLRIAVPNPDGRLLAGMFASVVIFLPSEDQTLSVPKSAVLEDEGRSFVFVHYENDYYVRRPVVPGRTFAGWAEITEGLTGNETVVAEGAFLMKSDVLRSKMGAGCAD